MKAQVAREMIRIIREERDKRGASLPADPEFAQEEWFSTHAPFVNELCLTVLVATHHQVERELIWVAARITDDHRDLDETDYLLRVDAERKSFRASKGRSKLHAKLQLERLASWRTEWEDSLETLRLLANCYKHDPSATADNELLEHLNASGGQISLNISYDSLPNSEAFGTGLARSLRLSPDAGYCEIAEAFLDRVDAFLAAVYTYLRADLSQVISKPWSFSDYRY